MKNINKQASHPLKAHPPATAQDTGSTRPGIVQATDTSGKNSRNDRAKADIGQQLGHSARKKMSGHPQAANHSRPIPQDSMRPQSPATPQTPVEPMPSCQPEVRRLPPAAHHQRSPTYPVSTNSTHAAGNAQDPGNPRLVEYPQAPRSPEMYAYPQSASHPEPSGYHQLYPQMQNDTAAFVYQATPPHAPSSGQTYVQGLPPDMDPYNHVYYNAARNGIFPQVPWNAGYYYTEQPSNIGAPWQAEPPHWLQDIQDPSYMWRNGAPARCGDQGCCRNCCGECCEREDAKRWEREQRMRESTLPCTRRSWHSECPHAAPCRAASCSALCLPQHVWSTGGSILTRSLSWPRIRDAHEHLEVDFAGDPFSWASNEAMSTSRYHYKPLGHFAEPSFESYFNQVTEECLERTCQPVDLVPRGLDVTYSLSPPGSWASYSLRTSHGPPPISAPPSTVNVHSNVCFSGTQPPPQPQPQPSLSSVHDTLYRVSSRIEDMGRGTTEQPIPVTATTTRTAATEVQFRFEAPRTEKRSVSVMTSLGQSDSDKSTGVTHHGTMFSCNVTPPRHVTVTATKTAANEIHAFRFESPRTDMRSVSVMTSFAKSDSDRSTGVTHHGTVFSCSVAPPRHVTATTSRTAANEVHFRFESPRTEMRNVSVMTSFGKSDSDRSTGVAHHGTMFSCNVVPPRHEQSRLRALEFETKVEQRQGNVSSSDHGWYQPLHITSQVSSSTGERSTGGTLHFLNFTWGSPERAPARGSDKALAVPGAVIKDVRPEINPFSWSSKALLKDREPTITQEFKPATEVLRDGAVYSGSLSSHDVSPKASKLASPVVFNTNLLHSATSENGDAHIDVGSPGSLPLEITSPLFEPVMGEQPQTYHFATSEEEAMEAVEGKPEDKEEHEDENEEKEGGDSDDAHEKAREEEEEAEEQEDHRKKKERKESHLAAVAPVAVAKASGKKYSKEYEDAEKSGSEASAGQADEERNPETGVSDAVRPLDELSSSSFKSAKDKPAPSRSKPRVKAAASVVSSPSRHELTSEQEEEADKAGERMDKELRDLELTTVELYPESRLVILLAILCLIWIIFLVLSSAVKHGLPPTTHEGSTTATTVTTAIYPTWWTPVTRVTTPTGSPYTSTTTQQPLRGIFICSSDYCQKEGNYLRSLTAHSTKAPCENFYEHVCGAWKKVATRMIQSVAGAAVSTDTVLQASMEARLLAYIKNRAHADVNPARTLYDMCMNRGAASSALLDAKKLLRQWGSDWPQKDSANSSPTDVWRFAAKLMQVLGVPSLVGIEIGLDPWNIELNIIELGPPRTVFYSKDVSEPRVMKLFSDATRTAAKALDPNDPTAGSAAAKDVSIALASISLLQLDDLGTSPLDFQVIKFTSLGNGVQHFLRTVFANIVAIDSSTRILAHRSPLVRQELDETVNSLPPRVMLNYLGLLALVALSPFLPEQLSSLRVLHSVHTLGRAETGSNDLLCLRAVSQAYPACLAAASHALYKNTQRSVWLSQLESLFVGYVRNVVWMDNLTSLFVRYKMRHHRLARFFPVWPLGDCNATNKTASSKAINTFVDAVGRRQTQELQQLEKPPLQLSTGSPLSVWPRYRLCLQLFQIPAGLVNASVPANSSVFVFHLSRLAVRLYAALAQLLYEGTVYEREIPLYFTEEAERVLEDLLDCLLCDARRRFPHGLRAERVQNALLEQVLALQMGFLAFRRLLSVRRIWRFDFRYSTFPEVSSDQLFFLYYALDHCELSDAVFESHQFEAYRRLPAAVRVNMAVRQSTRFAQAFRCPSGSPMVAGELCQVLR